MPLTEEQKAIRKKGVSGSEVAAVAGISKWATPADVWAEKMGLTDDMKLTPAMKRGIYLEQGILQWAQNETGLTIKHNPDKTFVSKDHELVIATPDGLVRAGGITDAATHSFGGEEHHPFDTIAEVKAPGFQTHGDWANPFEMPDGIPAYYLPQVMWEMAATGYKNEPAVVAALLGGNLNIYRVPWSEELYQALLAKVEMFWKYVEKQEPPPVDNNPASAKWVKAFYKQADEDLLRLEGTKEKEYRRIAQQYEVEKAKEKAAVMAKEHAAARLQEIIKDHAGLLGDGWQVTWKAGSGRIDYKYMAQQLHRKLQILTNDKEDPEKSFKEKTEGYRGEPIRRFLVKIPKEGEE